MNRLIQFSDFVTALRQLHGISQQEVADELSITRQAVNTWETGKSLPESHHLLPIVRAFDMNEDLQTRFWQIFIHDAHSRKAASLARAAAG